MSTTTQDTGQTAVGLYLRISRDFKGEGAGVERQRDECLKDIITPNNWTLVGVYEDNDISATDGSERKDWNRLLRDVRSGKVNRIVAWGADRLARDTVDTGLLEREAKQRGILITIHPGTTYDLREPAELLNFKLLLAIGGFESDQKKKRQRAAAKQSRMSGKPYLRRRVFGYQVNEAKRPLQDENPYDCTVLDDVEAKAVQWAYGEVLAGKSYSSIARDLNERGILTVAGGQWKVSTIKRLLLTPLYAGIPYRSVDRGKSYELFPDVEPQWTPIVDRETWYAAQEAITIKASQFNRGASRTPKKNWLSGVVSCWCGAPMRSNMTELRCSSVNHVTTIRTTLIEPIITKDVLGVIALRGRALQLSDPVMEKIEELRNGIKELEADLEEVMKIKRRDIRTREINAITDEIDEMRDEIARLNASRSISGIINDLVSPIVNGHITMEDYSTSLEIVRTRWEELSLAQKSKIAQRLGHYVIAPKKAGIKSQDRLRIFRRDPLTGEVDPHTVDEDPHALLT